jgi:hypothetical protein
MLLLETKEAMGNDSILGHFKRRFVLITVNDYQ